MTDKISALEAEKLSETPISDQDAAYLRCFYAQQRFIIPEPFLERLKKPSLSDADIVNRHRDLIIKMGLDPSTMIPDEKVVLNFREHGSTSTEFMGDWPRKIKKWTIFILSDHAARLASGVFFAAFRLDDLNACTLKLPSGATAVAINVAYLAITPFLYSAFLNIYEAGVREDGTFRVSSSENSATILQMAKLFAAKDFDALPSVMRRIALRGDAFRMSLNASILASLHECAHNILGHLQVSEEIERRLSGIEAQSWQFAQRLEYDADLFAVRHLLHLDDRVTQQWAFEIAMHCTILFGFTHLVSEYAATQGRSHPLSTFRWTNVREEFVSVMGSELVVKRLEFIIEALTGMKQLYDMNAINS